MVLTHEMGAAGAAAVPGLAVTLERLQVAEGGAARLTPAAIKLAMTGVTSVRYSVTGGPSHGWLKVRRSRLVRMRKNYYVRHFNFQNNIFPSISA